MNTLSDDAKQPLHALDDLRAALEGEGVHIEGGIKCLSTLTLHVGNLVDCIAFVEAVIGLLQSGNFYRHQASQEDPTFFYDAYGFHVPDDLARKFKLKKLRNWYFGFTLAGKAGRRALVVSAHPLDRDMTTADGTLLKAGK